MHSFRPKFKTGGGREGFPWKMDQTSPHLSLSLSLSPTLVSLCVALGVAVSVSLLASEICIEYFDLTTDLPNSPVCVCVFSAGV
mmetsp:Transcript_16914/g.13869  ORF Transcript_16914/g.13869 Transcript_16914/m.13869 type:complete len:84 (-) Transcript_16914:1361-1612(-)